MVEVYRLTEEGLVKIGSSGLLGQIRSLTAGDLDGDGCAEVVTDSGLSSRAGVFTVLGWDAEKQELVTRLRVDRSLADDGFWHGHCRRGRWAAALYGGRMGTVKPFLVGERPISSCK